MHVAILVVTIAYAFIGPSSGTALQPATPLARLGRQAWSMENGLPQNTVPVLMQSRSGYLWAGTELGLARFDGTSFRTLDHATTPAFPDAEIRCLLDASDGSIWIGTGDGLVRWKEGYATLFTTKNGLPTDSIQGLVQTSDNTIWVWTEQGLARWITVDSSDLSRSSSTSRPSAGSFVEVQIEAGYQKAAITSLALGSDASLWMGTTAGAAIFQQGHWRAFSQGAASASELRSTSFVASVPNGDVLIATADGVSRERQGHVEAMLPKAALPRDGVSFLSELSDGTVAVASKSELVTVQNHHVSGLFSTGRQLPGSRIESIYPDKEGCLWIGTNHGLARILGGQAQLFPATDPLAVNAAVSILEDREGDIWVGTENSGLHILRDSRFRNIGVGEGLSSDATTAVVQDTHGIVWIGTRESGLNRVSSVGTAETPSSLTTANGLISNVILSLAASSSGDIWVGTPDGLNRIHNGAISSYSSADGLPDDFIRSLLVSSDGSVWVGTRHGLTHIDLSRSNQDRFHSYTRSDGLGSDLVGALSATNDGDLWIATLNGLTRLHNGSLRNYTTADGLSSNVVTALDGMPDGKLWIGTQGSGLNLWDGSRFRPIHDETGQLPTAIHAILPDEQGHLWLASNSGLTRADTDSLLSCAQNGKCAIASTRFSTADGLRTRETSSNSHPTACRSRDGQLWFTTPRGVIVTDPLHFAPNPPPPPVAIERFAVDDQDQNADEVSKIAAGHLRFQFDYAGLSFAAPQKLRYEYMLEGFDHGWTDAGTRRTAYYTNIPAGQYRFRVRASFGGFLTAGNESESELAFELRPHFYQTAWFIVLVLLFAALVVWLTFQFVFRRRVRRVEREFRAVMAERNRIAREIHDTLAQGYVGISVQLEVLGELLRHNRAEAAARHLDMTQGYVREGLEDARRSIWALRSHDAAEQTLPVHLRRLVEQAQSSDLATSLEIHGAYRALSPDAEKEILRIAQEAIHNVKKHASASRMSVRVDYDDESLTLSVSDDGKGFVPVQQNGAYVSMPGHFGLTGMKERADLIAGHLEIISFPGRGSTVRLRVSAPAVDGRDQPSRVQQISPDVSSSVPETVQGSEKE